jgi:hypothetical protein
MGMGTFAGKPSIWLSLSAKTGQMTRWVRGEGGANGHEEVVNYVTGRVTGVGVHEKEWPGGDKSFMLQVRMKDDASDERYVIELGASSRLATRLLGQLNAADLSQELYFAPYLLKEGQQLQGSNEVIGMDTPLVSLKPVLGADGDKLRLGEGIKPYFGEQYGDKMPKSEPLLNPKTGQQITQNGRPMFDNSEREQLAAELIQVVSAKLKGTAVNQAEEADDGVSPSEAAAAANSAQMRARA